MDRGCRNCMWLYHMVTYNPTAPCSECLDYNKWQTTKTTHYDEIRAMSIEEIENWFWWMHKEMMWYTDSRVFLHDWLRQEVSDGRN